MYPAARLLVVAGFGLACEAVIQSSRSNNYREQMTGVHTRWNKDSLNAQVGTKRKGEECAASAKYDARSGRVTSAAMTQYNVGS